MPKAGPTVRSSRGHKKRERTRNLLLTAGVEVLAEKGEALTASDVVAKAEVSNGTFYNYFTDREEFLEAVASHSLLELASAVAMETAEQDAARRFAVATARILGHVAEDPLWGRAVLRLADGRRLDHEVMDYVRADIASGFEQGRFRLPADEITIDLVVGLMLMSIRRIIEGGVSADYVLRVVERALVVLGVARKDAASLATESVGLVPRPFPVDSTSPWRRRSTPSVSS